MVKNVITLDRFRGSGTGLHNGLSFVPPVRPERCVFGFLSNCNIDVSWPAQDLHDFYQNIS